MNNNLPKFWNYGNYSSDNYGAHSMAFQDAHGNIFYFSYKTLVAFSSAKTGKVVRENIWGTTTGKHLNWIDGGNKAARVTEERFNELLSSITD